MCNRIPSHKDYVSAIVTRDGQSLRIHSDKRVASGLSGLVGYLRVSSLGKKELRQLEDVHLDKRLLDKASGKDLHRPELEKRKRVVCATPAASALSAIRCARHDARTRHVWRRDIAHVVGGRF